MAIEVKWIQESRKTIKWTVSERWTYSDYHRAIVVTRKMMAEQAPKPISVLLDMRDTYMVPTGVISAIVKCHHEGWLPENYDHSVVFSQQPIIKQIYSILNSIPSLDGKLTHVETAEEMRQSFGCQCQHSS